MHVGRLEGVAEGLVHALPHFFSAQGVVFIVASAAHARSASTPAAEVSS